jgi:pilus assembly protein CpaC
VTRHLLGLVTVLAFPVLLAAQAPPQQPPATPPAVVAQPPTPAAQAAAPAVSDASARVDRIVLTAGRSTVLTTDFDITRIAITNPAVADATVVQPREILLDGKGSGTVSLIIWGAGARKQYDIVVEPGVSTLQQQLQALFPGEDITVRSNDDALILSGRVSSTAVMLKAGEIAKASASKAKVMNLLQLPGATGSQQVMLQVRFAEVNRKAVQELGVSLFTGAAGYKNFVARSTTQQFAAPTFDNTTTPPALTFSDFLNLFVFNTEHNLGAVVRALQSKGYFQSLAEPNLIAYNGQEASFLAGGEFPVPVVQGLTNAVTIVWKEFGVRLKFTPTIAGDTIRLKVEPEVSSLDFTNGITLQGFRIPSLITRRAQTDVELRDGQSFAIAGLLHNTTQENGSGIPWLSSIPIVGNLFKSKADQKEQTELMVLITPQLVRPLEPDEVPRLPVNPKRFLPGQGIGSELQGGGGLVDAPPVKKDEKAKPALPVKKQGGEQ